MLAQPIPRFLVLGMRPPIFFVPLPVFLDLLVLRLAIAGGLARRSCQQQRRQSGEQAEPCWQLDQRKPLHRGGQHVESARRRQGPRCQLEADDQFHDAAQATKLVDQIARDPDRGAGVAQQASPVLLADPRRK